MLKSIAVSVAACAWLMTFAAPGRAAETTRPNVLFIAVDDLNDWIGVMGGHPQARTPNYDRLAARGMFFDHAYCAAPSCNPSRVAVLTGFRPSTTGMYVNDQKFRKVFPDAVTLPQHFTRHGYRVAGGGKIFHHGDTDPRSWPEYFDQPRDPLPKTVPPIGLANHEFRWEGLKVGDEAMGDYKVVSWASKFLADPGERPFFLAVGLFRPHMPWHVPQPYFDRHPLASVQLPVVRDDDLADIPSMGRWLATHTGAHEQIVDSGQWQLAVQAYLACVEFSDAMLGRLLDALDRSPARDHTIIVLWSDHGMHQGQKEHWTKFALWEQTTHVPLFFVVPGMTKAGQRCPAPVSLLDLYPTLTELCAIPPAAGVEGISLVPQLKDPAAPRAEPAVMTFGPGNHAVRDARWRYIRYKDGGEELYDHQTDEREWTNLADRPEFASVKRDLARWMPATDKPITTPTKWLRPE